MSTRKIPAYLYQQFDADPHFDVPAEGFNGWIKKNIDVSLDHTALIVMHAWDCKTQEDFPGWYRYVEYLPRAKQILNQVFPVLLNTVRKSPLRIIHVVSSGDYYKSYMGYQMMKKIWKGRVSKTKIINKDPTRKQLDEIRSEFAGVGPNNKKDIDNVFKEIDFAKEARPLDSEYIVENSEQLFAVCNKLGINHLIYTGFAINWCLLFSPGGMADMVKHGFLCSTIRQAVTAVENKETARNELCKEIALWRVALAFGFVFDLDDFLHSLL
jgi:nicotinamidase-related amidase